MLEGVSPFLRPISFFLVLAGYLSVLQIYWSRIFHAHSDAHFNTGLDILLWSNVIALVLFSITGFQNLTLPNYITVAGGLFGVLIGLYSLYIA